MNILTSAPAGRRRHLARAALVGTGALLVSGLGATAAFAAPPAAPTVVQTLTPMSTSLNPTLVNDQYALTVAITPAGGVPVDLSQVLFVSSPGGSLTINPGGSATGAGCPVGAAPVVGAQNGATQSVTLSSASKTVGGAGCTLNLTATGTAPTPNGGSLTATAFVTNTEGGNSGSDSDSYFIRSANTNPPSQNPPVQNPPVQNPPANPPVTPGCPSNTGNNNRGCGNSGNNNRGNFNSGNNNRGDNNAGNNNRP